MKKIVLSLLTLFPFIVLGAPCPSVNGCTNVSNPNSAHLYFDQDVHLSSSASSALNINDLVKGSRPFPVKTETERDAISSPETGLIIYNSTTKTLDYYDGAVWQKVLITPNILAGSNITITDNGNGTVTVNSTGGGDIPAPSYAAYSVRGNMAPRPAIAGSFVAVPVSSGFNDDQDACFTTSIESIGGINTPVSRNICPETQFFAVDQSVSMQGIAATFRQYIYAIAIARASGSIETTNYRLVATQNSDPANDHPTSMHGIVQLAQGDGVFTQVYGAGSDQTAPTTYINSKIESMAGSATPTFQNIYENSGSLPYSSFDLQSGGEFAITYPPDEIALSAYSGGIASTLGLRLLPSSGTEEINYLQTTNPTSTLGEMISTTRGVIAYPAMTFLQGAAISGTKPTGLGFYNTTNNTITLWDGSQFTSLVNTTSAQTISGSKTFSSNIVGNLTGTAAVATTGSTVVTSANSSFYPIFVASTTNGNQIFNLGSNLSFNPATNNLMTNTFTGSLVGNADSATQINTTSNSSNTAFYLPFVASSSGGNQALNINSGLNFNPLAGVLTTPNLVLNALSGDQLIGLNSGKIAASIGAGISTQVLHGNASGLPTWSALNLQNDVTNTLLFANGGFGFTTATLGDIFYASAANTPGKLADVATGSVLVSGGVGIAPAYSSTPSVSTASLTGGGGSISALTLGASASAITGTTPVIDFSSNYSDASYLRFGQNGALGVTNSGRQFFTKNLDYDGSTSNYKYMTSAFGYAIELSAGGFIVSTAPSGTAGNTATMTTVLSATNGSASVTGAFSIAGVAAAPLSGITPSLSFGSSLSDGNYINLGGSGRDIGVLNSGNTFLSNNLDWNAGLNTYQYSNSAAASVIELGPSGGSIKYAPSGTSGASITPTTVLGWDTAGNINLISATNFLFANTSFNSLLIKSTAGSPNNALIDLERNDQTDGYAGARFGSANSLKFEIGLRAGDGSLHIYDNTNSINQLVMTPGSGTTGVNTFAGSVVAQNVTLNGQSANGLVTTDGSKVLTTITSPTSWTPTIGDGVNNFTVSQATGAYYRLGPLVWSTGQIVWTGKGSANPAGALILSLPVTQGASSPLAACSFGFSQGIGFTGSQFEGYINTSSAQIILTGFSNTGVLSSILVSNAATTGNIVYTCIYSAV